MTFLRPCFLTSSLAPERTVPQSQDVSNSHVIVTRPALCCVCDHEDFMSVEVALFFNSVLCHLRNLSVVLVVSVWKFCHQFVCVWRLKNTHQQRVNWCKFCVILVFRPWIRFSLHSGFNTSDSCFCHCYHSTGFSVLLPYLVAPRFLPFQLNWMSDVTDADLTLTR